MDTGFSHQENEDLFENLYEKIKVLEEENERLSDELKKYKPRTKQHDSQKQSKGSKSKNSASLHHQVRPKKSSKIFSSHLVTSCERCKSIMEKFVSLDELNVCQKESLFVEDGIPPLHVDKFVTYKKRKGTHDSGKEFEYMMCAFFAVKLSTDANIADFKMTTNNENYGDFDDISLEITYRDGTLKTYLLQLKHKDSKKYITNADLASPKNDFSLLKYMKSFEEIEEEEVICILYTNNATSILDASRFTFLMKPSEKEKNRESDQQCLVEILVKKVVSSDHLQLMTNKTSEHSSDIFQFEIGGDVRKFKKINQFCKQFYLFPNQHNLYTVKSSVHNMLKKLLQQDVYDLFVHYMKEWWSGRFVLTKHDTIAKMVELALSPWIKTISRSRTNKKSKIVKESIMNFELSIVKDPKNEFVEHIWTGTSAHHYKFGKAAQKYFCTSGNNLSREQKSKILWHMDEVPLILTTNDKNKMYIKKALELLQKNKGKKKIVLIGRVEKDEFSEWNIFENLFDLREKNRDIYDKIIKIFNVSLQGKRKIALEELIMSGGEEIMQSFEVNEILNMSQNVFLPIGVKEKRSVKSYISRSVSTIFLSLPKLLRCLTCLTNVVMIINCERNQKNICQGADVTVVELPLYLKEQSHRRHCYQRLLLLSIDKKCTPNEFDVVCRTHRGMHVYLLQVFDENCCALVLKKGNNLPMEEIKSEQLKIDETEIFQHFNNQLNVFCAPPGMGKSTLFSVLTRNCPPSFWCMHVKLIDHNFILRTRPNNDQLLMHFIKTETVINGDLLQFIVKKALLKNKKMYVLLDGLDEVDSEYTERILDFAKHLSAEGNFVWISTRENLREKVVQYLNVISIEIRELSHDQQSTYIQQRLRKHYDDYEIGQIVDLIFASTDVVSSQKLLGVPLQLFMITENFINDKTLYPKLNEKRSFVLTTMYKMFFEGKKKFLYQKTGIEQQAKQIGYSFKIYLKQYEIPALKSCLDTDVFEKLNISEDESSEFLEGISEEGDKFGIIAHVNQNIQAIFTHQTYAEYFACVWLAKHLDKIRFIKKEMFSDRYQNLKLIFDIMMSEERPLHLAIIYKSSEQFEKYLDEINIRDRGGRTALHLACSYGTKYPKVAIRIEQESSSYVQIVENLIGEDTDVYESDTLFNFNYVQYSIESMCLHPIEVMLRKKVLKFSTLDRATWNGYDSETLAYYAAQLGYPNLLSYVIEKNPHLIDKEIGGEYLLHTAVIGCKNEIYTTVRKGNIAATEILLKNGADVNRVLEENFFRREILSILDYVCQHKCYDMLEILMDNDARCTQGNTILHRIAQYQTVDDQVMGTLENYSVDINARNSNGITALHLACENGHVESAKKLLEKKVNVNVSDNDGNNSLHYACQSKAENTEIISLLIDGGVEVNCQNRNGTTALHFASLFGKVAAVKLLVENGASNTILDNYGKSPLHHACQTRKENLEIINVLVDSGFGTDEERKSLTTAVQLACKNGHTGIVKKLLELTTKSSIIDDQHKNLLHFACQSKRENVEIIDLLLSHGFDVDARNKNGTTALHLSCKHGHARSLKKLVAKGADVNISDKDNKNALHYAYQSLTENTQVVQFLLSCDIDVNARDKCGTTALHLACLNGQTGIAEKLLEKRTDVNIVDDCCKTALHFACQSFKENPVLVNLLLNYGIDVNAQSKNGATALHLACFNGQVEIAKDLIREKSVIHSIDTDSKNPLHYACQSLKENTELVKLLIENGIDVNARNRYGTTALHISCENGHGKNATELLDSEAKVDILDCNENNALHYACRSRKGNAEIIRTLVNRGLNVNSRNKFGTTPLQLACQNGQVDNIMKLLEYGADVDLVDNNNNDALYYLRESTKNNELIDLLVHNGRR